MSLELSLDKLAQALTIHAEALDRNTAAGLKLTETQAAKAPATINIKGTPDTDIVEKIAEAAGKVDTDQETPKKATKKKATKKKAEPKPEPEPETVDEPEPEVEDDTGPADDNAKAVATLDDVRDAAIRLRDTVGKDALEKAKKAFKIGPVKDLPEENRAMFVRHCNDQIAAAEV